MVFCVGGEGFGSGGSFKALTATMLRYEDLPDYTVFLHADAPEFLGSREQFLEEDLGIPEIASGFVHIADPPVHMNFPAYFLPTRQIM